MAGRGKTAPTSWNRIDGRLLEGGQCSWRDLEMVSLRLPPRSIIIRDLLTRSPFPTTNIDCEGENRRSCWTWESVIMTGMPRLCMTEDKGSNNRTRRGNRGHLFSADQALCPVMAICYCYIHHSPILPSCSRRHPIRQCRSERGAQGGGRGGHCSGGARYRDVGSELVIDAWEQCDITVRWLFPPLLQQTKEIQRRQERH